jgi:hypothetical protein
MSLNPRTLVRKQAEVIRGQTTRRRNIRPKLRTPAQSLRLAAAVTQEGEALLEQYRIAVEAVPA